MYNRLYTFICTYTNAIYSGMIKFSFDRNLLFVRIKTDSAAAVRILNNFHNMPEFQVTCITKPNRESKHEHITHIGNIANKWRLTRGEAIRRIDAKEQAYYTIEPRTQNKAYV